MAHQHYVTAENNELKNHDFGGTILNRNDNIDILKTFCAFFVVSIHASFPGEIGNYFVALARIAVPIFFIITGYFYSDVIKRGREKIHIKKILKLMILANLLYLVWSFLIAIFKGDIAAFQAEFTIKSLLEFVFLNESPFAGHLWYFGAILYVLIIVWLTDKMHCRKLLYILTPILLIGDLVLGKYSIALFQMEFPYVFVRNFLFVGIPYFCIGCLIKRGMGRQIKNNVLKLCIIIFAALSLLERFILVNTNMNATRDHYISTTFLAVFVFLFALKSELHVWKGFAVIGKKYSTWIYILHPIFIEVFSVVTHKLGIYEAYEYIAAIVVFISTLGFLFALDWVLAWIRRKRAV